MESWVCISFGKQNMAADSVFLFAYFWPSLPISISIHTELNESMVHEKVTQDWFL